MKKIFKNLFFVAIASTMLLSCTTAKVGGVGGTGNVNGSTNTTVSNKPATPAIKPVIKIDPAAKKIASLKVISCYGDSQTGDVNIVISATALGRSTEMVLANYSRDIESYDKDGNLFKGKEIAVDGKSGKKDLPKDIPVKFEIAFIDVPSNVSTLEVINCYFDMWSANGNSSGDMQIRNVPIQWDVQ